MHIYLPNNNYKNRIRVVTWNIHKGVHGIGPLQRLEIENIKTALSQFHADIICLQEVRAFNHLLAKRFNNWPHQNQALYLASSNFYALYRTNAITKHGEHGNALLSRYAITKHQHKDISDHRFEQRGLLHARLTLPPQSAKSLPHNDNNDIHVIVVHLGLIASSRTRQITQLIQFIEHEVPPHAPLIVAGDFNEWGSRITRILKHAKLYQTQTLPPISQTSMNSAPLNTRNKNYTYPSRLPLAQLDYVYARGLTPLHIQIPHDLYWRKMSDHLPLIAEFELPV